MAQILSIQTADMSTAVGFACAQHGLLQIGANTIAASRSLPLGGWHLDGFRARWRARGPAATGFRRDIRLATGREVPIVVKAYALTSTATLTTPAADISADGEVGPGGVSGVLDVTTVPAQLSAPASLGFLGVMAAAAATAAPASIAELRFLSTAALVLPTATPSAMASLGFVGAMAAASPTASLAATCEATTVIFLGTLAATLPRVVLSASDQSMTAAVLGVRAFTDPRLRVRVLADPVLTTSPYGDR